MSIRTLALAALVTPGVAAACEAGNCAYSFHPDDAATDVPTNTSLWLFFDTTGGSYPSAVLTDAAGATVEASSELVSRSQLTVAWQAVLRITPNEPLSPDATYTITWDVPDDVCDAQVSSTFTTGGGPDAEAPSAPSVAEASAELIEGQPAIGPCDAGPERHVYMVAASGDAPLYALYHDGTQVDLWRQNTLFYQAEGTGPAPDACFTVASLDWSGNVSAQSAPSCLGVEDDTAAPVDTGDTGDTDGGGCGCSASGGGPPPWWSAAPLAAVMLRRRIARARPAAPR